MEGDDLGRPAGVENRIERRTLIQTLGGAGAVDITGDLSDTTTELEGDDDRGTICGRDDEVKDDYSDENRDIDPSELNLGSEDGCGELHESVVISDDEARGVLLIGNERTEGTGLVGVREFWEDNEFRTEEAT